MDRRQGDPVVRPDYEPPMLDELSEQIILSAVERPVRHGGGGALMAVRVMNAELMGPGYKPGVYFKVTANITVLGEVKQWRSEGYDLNVAIRETIGQIPQSYLYPQYVNDGKGFMVPAPPHKAPGAKRVVRRKKPNEQSTPTATASEPEPSPPKRRRVVRRG